MRLNTNANRAMESRNHFKNGASLKSLRVGEIMKIFKNIFLCTMLLWSVNAFAQNRDYKKNVFELDLALGSSVKAWSPGFTVGIGWLHNYSDYFAWDILRLDVGNSFEHFDAKNTGFTLWTGSKVCYPLSNAACPFFAFRIGAGGITIDNGLENVGFSISPEIGANLSRKFYIAVGYAHSWSETTIKGTTTERYVKGSHQVYLSSSRTYMTVNDYGTRTVNTSETIKNSIGNLYLRFGFNF